MHPRFIHNMNNISNLSRTATEICTYLKNAGIEFSLVTHSPAFTIEECAEVEKLIGGKICKNLFLQTTSGNTYYLLMLDGAKKFVTKDVSKKLGSSRLSFAPPEAMQSMLNTLPGSLSVTSLVFDKEKRVSLAIDSDILKEEFICCHPSDNSATLKIKTRDITEKLLPLLGIEHEIIEI